LSVLRLLEAVGATLKVFLLSASSGDSTWSWKPWMSVALQRKLLILQNCPYNQDSVTYIKSYSSLLHSTEDE